MDLIFFFQVWIWGCHYIYKQYDIF